MACILGYFLLLLNDLTDSQAPSLTEQAERALRSLFLSYPMDSDLRNRRSWVFLLDFIISYLIIIIIIYYCDSRIAGGGRRLRRDSDRTDEPEGTTGARRRTRPGTM